MMLIDGFLPEGVTRLAVDSIFMMPQLGVLAEVHEKSATEVFEKDCLIHLGTLIAPVGTSQEGKPCVKIEATLPDGTALDDDVPFGDMRVYPLAVGETARVKVTPARGLDVGAGPGKLLEATLSGGVVGLMVDARGRPFTLPVEEQVGYLTEARSLGELADGITAVAQLSGGVIDVADPAAAGGGVGEAEVE